MNADRGILYVATGERYFDEVRRSARSVKHHMPSVPVLLYTDQPEAFSDSFDEIRRIDFPRHFFADKVAPLVETPFEKTLFLDTDTLVCADISDVFDLLDRFDVALAHAPMRHDRFYPTPNCFAEMNSGVLAYRRNDRVRQMFARWMEIYEDELATSPNPEKGDQVHLRKAVYESDVSLYILPPEYNYRSVMLGWAARQKVRIIHGRAASIENVASQINSSTSSRVIFPSLDLFSSRHVIFLDPAGKIFMRCMDMLVRLIVSLKRLVSR